jgi:hypothetical protein
MIADRLVENSEVFLLWWRELPQTPPQALVELTSRAASRRRAVAISRFEESTG